MEGFGISKFASPFKPHLLLFAPPSLASNTFPQRKVWVSNTAYDVRCNCSTLCSL